MPYAVAKPNKTNIPPPTGAPGPGGNGPGAPYTVVGGFFPLSGRFAALVIPAKATTTSSNIIFFVQIFIKEKLLLSILPNFCQK